MAGAAWAEAWGLVGVGLEEGALCWGARVHVPGLRVEAAPPERTLQRAWGAGLRRSLGLIRTDNRGRQRRVSVGSGLWDRVRGFAFCTKRGLGRAGAPPSLRDPSVHLFVRNTCCRVSRGEEAKCTCIFGADRCQKVVQPEGSGSTAGVRRPEAGKASLRS